jgi:hypothetical protein
MSHPTKDDPIIVRSNKDYIKFAEKYIFKEDGREPRLGGMTEPEYLAHVRKFWGVPPSYPARVWIFITEAADEVGPTFPETNVRWETKAELKKKLEEFDK